MSEVSTRPPFGPALLSVVALACAAGCMGGQTGTEQFDPPAPQPEAPMSPGRPASDNGSPCDEEQEPLDADDASLGFSANEVLAFVIGEETTELRWQPSSADASFGPERGIVSLELAVSLVGNVRKVRSVPKPANGNGAGPAIAVACPPDRLEADVELRLATAGGALDERIAAELSASDSQSAWLSASIPLAQVSGSFRVVPAANVKTESLEISAIFSPFGNAGVLSGRVEAQESAGAAREGGIEYGRWPADENCAENLTPVVSVALSDPAAGALRSAVERLRGVEAAPLEWSSLGSTSLTFAIETAEQACFRPGNSPSNVHAGLPAPPFGLELPVAVQVETGDGRVNTTLEGLLGTRDGVESATLGAGHSCSGATVELQAEACGLSDVDFSGLGDLSIWLNADVAPGAVSGDLRILGVRPTTCEPTPNSSCGSSGPEPIETGEF